MSLTNTAIQEALLAKFPEANLQCSEPYGMLTVEAAKDFNLKILQFLYIYKKDFFWFLNGAFN